MALSISISRESSEGKNKKGVRLECCTYIAYPSKSKMILKMMSSYWVGGSRL